MLTLNLTFGFLTKKCIFNTSKSFVKNSDFTSSQWQRLLANYNKKQRNIVYFNIMPHVTEALNSVNIGIKILRKSETPNQIVILFISALWKIHYF